MQKVIGGEFVINNEAYIDSTLIDARYYYSCGRMAFKAILSKIFLNHEGTVLLPDHICESVPKVASELGLKCYFYHVDIDFHPEMDSILEKIDDVKAILLVNYFGLISEHMLTSLIDKIKMYHNDITIIMDNVQNYYGMNDMSYYDFAFTSFRKWFPVPDGSIVLWKNGNDINELYPDEKNTQFCNHFSKYKFAGNVLKNYKDIVGDEICIELLEKGEKILDNCVPQCSIEWTSIAMERLDFLNIKNRRIQNAMILHEGLTELGIDHLYQDETAPLFIPIILKSNRDRMRKAFFDKMIFTPIHWDEEWKKNYADVCSNPLSSFELSLICDQRYGETEMKYQLEILADECENCK